jgi:hypothetical protein
MRPQLCYIYAAQTVGSNVQKLLSTRRSGHIKCQKILKAFSQSISKLQVLLGLAGGGFNYINCSTEVYIFITFSVFLFKIEEKNIYFDSNTMVKSLRVLELQVLCAEP